MTCFQPRPVVSLRCSFAYSSSTAIHFCFWLIWIVKFRFECQMGLFCSRFFQENNPKPYITIFLSDLSPFFTLNKLVRSKTPICNTCNQTEFCAHISNLNFPAVLRVIHQQLWDSNGVFWACLYLNKHLRSVWGKEEALLLSTAAASFLNKHHIWTHSLIQRLKAEAAEHLMKRHQEVWVAFLGYKFWSNLVSWHLTVVKWLWRHHNRIDSIMHNNWHDS